MEWFLRGTEQARYALKTGEPRPAAGSGSVSVAARILSPANGTILALDPDIPPERQRLTLRTDGTHTRWLMDGKSFAKGSTAQWLPWPGRHVVQLVSANGEKLDEVRVEVRGAGAAVGTDKVRR